jgi:GDP-L-fucose synthase
MTVDTHARRALVLGGHGFLGRHLVGALERAGIEVHVRSRRDGVDARDVDAVQAAIAETAPHYVFNAATHGGSLHYVTEYAADVAHDNTTMALNVYRAVRTAAPDAIVINPLSNCSYPGDAVVQREEEWWSGPVHDSVWAVGNSKRLTHVLSRCYAKQYGVRSINLLVPNAFGPGDYTDPNKTHALNGLIIRMLEAQRRGDRQFTIWGTGSPVREWGYIKDIAALLVSALDVKDDLVEPVNMGQGRAHTIRESAEIVRRAVGHDCEFVFDTTKQDGAPRKVLDDARFRRIFGEFRFTDHEAAVTETVAYYRSALWGNDA